MNYKEEMLKNSGLVEREFGYGYGKSGVETVKKAEDRFNSCGTKHEKKNKDVYMSKDTDLSCKYCKERYDTEEALDKHQKTCMA